MKIKLKPCPFCGEEAHTKYWMSRVRWYVTCGSCNARTAHYLDRNDAIKAWNRRAYNGDDKFDIENREKPKENEKWWHFKGKLYMTLFVAKHTETGEELVIYKNGDGDIFAHPLDMFMSEVDRKKHPDARQKHRFVRVQK